MHDELCHRKRPIQLSVKADFWHAMENRVRFRKKIRKKIAKIVLSVT